MPLSLYALALLCFAVGAAEFVIAGILPDISNAFFVSVDIAGYLITAYAIGVVIFAPIIVILAIKLNLSNKTAILYLIIIFIIGNLIAVLANSFNVLLIGRVISSITHGAGFGIGAVLATSLVAKDKQNMAIAIMFTGLTLANVLGVPLGTALGQFFGWRSTFIFILIISVITFFAVLTLIKNKPTKHNTNVISIKDELKALANWPIILSFLTTTTGFAGVFLVLTHIASLLTNVSNIQSKYISPILVLFGLALVIGNLIGGKLSDKSLTKASYLFISLFSFFSLIFYFAAPFAIASIIVFMVWGFFSFAMTPPLQGRILHLAIKAPNLASTFNVAAFNLGITLGSAIANIMIANHFSFNSLSIASATLSFIALILLTSSLKLQHKIIKL